MNKLPDVREIIEDVFLCKTFMSPSILSLYGKECFRSYRLLHKFTIHEGAIYSRSSTSKSSNENNLNATTRGSNYFTAEEILLESMNFQITIRQKLIHSRMKIVQRLHVKFLNCL